MDWTVNDNLYNRFLKWKLKCEKILECELAMLAETRKCKKVIAWSGDFGIDQYVCWCLTPEELCVDVIGPNFLQARSDNWPRKWKAQKLQLSTSSKWQMNHKQPMFIWWDTNAQNWHPASFKESKRNPLDQGKPQTSTARKINKEKDATST